MSNDDWIPAKKKKPNDGRVVLVTFYNSAMHRSYIGFAWYSKTDRRWIMQDKGVKVIAWQDRPDPYAETR